MLRIPSTFYDDMKNNEFVLFQECEQVCQTFYRILLEKLGLNSTQMASYLAQMSKINQLKQDKSQFRQLVGESWVKFMTENSVLNLTSFFNQQEVKSINDFFTQVLCNPLNYDGNLIKELFRIYEKYFNSNKGIAIIETRQNIRALVIRLINSKALISYTNKFQSIKGIIADIIERVVNRQLAEPQEREIDINNLILNDGVIGEKFKQFLLAPNRLSLTRDSFQFLCYQMTEKMLENFKTQISVEFELIHSFLAFIETKDKILNDSVQYDKNAISKYFMDIYTRFPQTKDVGPMFRQLYNKLKMPVQNLDYREILKTLVSADLYSKEHEQQMILICEDLQPKQKRTDILANKFQKIYFNINQKSPLAAQDLNQQFQTYISFIYDIDYITSTFINFTLVDGTSIRYDLSTKYSQVSMRDGRTFANITLKDAFLKTQTK